MKRTRTHTLLRRAAVVTALVTATAIGAATALAAPEAPDVPSDIAVEAGHKLFLVGHAVGVQIYRCDAVPGGHRWNFVAPRADVYDDAGKLLMTHFAGPTWQARDGSYVKGMADRRYEVVGTIPWLRLARATSAAGADGDRLKGTTFIQRIATTGGLAPAAETCNAGTAGNLHESGYTADYTFWKAIGD
jgi:Protein of unknown function (DUF3455)